MLRHIKLQLALASLSQAQFQGGTAHPSIRNRVLVQKDATGMKFAGQWNTRRTNVH
jgi:hypothetical protein